MNLNSTRKFEIEAIVESLLNLGGYSINSKFVNIVGFMKKMGFVTGVADLKSDEDGLLLISSEKKVIAVNFNRCIERKRYIIAHQFGHYILHYILKDKFGISTQEITLLHRENKMRGGVSEDDIDYFAAALLMPREMFKTQYELYKNKGFEDNLIYYELGIIFGVPFEIVQQRI